MQALAPDPEQPEPHPQPQPRPGPGPNPPPPGHINDRHPNFRDEDGRLYLVRCFACAPDKGFENYVLAVARGVCAWCGWREATGYGG